MHRIILSFLGSLLTIASAWSQDRPNIVLIISDDHAWTDYGFMDHPHLDTPHLDQLAADSLTYTRGYVTSPLCRPSLASILTGLHTPVHGITGNDIRVPRGPDGQRRSMRARVDPEWAPKHEQLYAGFEKWPNIARSLTEAGYLSLQTGKYWEGKPERAGFTHAMTHADPKRGGRHGDAGLKISREGIQPIQTFLDDARDEEKPFFIWHAPFLPHTPHNPPQDLHFKYQQRESNPFVSRYYAMVEWFDQICGELLGELDKRGLTEKTMVVYVTDNGWIQDPDSAKYAARSKQAPYEGGIRTPIMVKWPGKITPQRNDHTLASAIDIAPTILTACNVPVPDTMKGLDLRDTPALAKRNVIHGYDGHHDIADVADRTANLETRYIVQGEWKLLLHQPQADSGNPDQDEVAELYHITSDPHEKVDLASSHPDIVTSLTMALDHWWRPDQT